jgi:glycine/serine hydroxymethyltransferase
MQTVADLMDEALAARADEAKLAGVRESVREFALRFPVPGIE